VTFFPFDVRPVVPPVATHTVTDNSEEGDGLDIEYVTEVDSVNAALCSLDVGVKPNCLVIIALCKVETKFSVLFLIDVSFESFVLTSCIPGFLVLAREIQTSPRDSLAQERPYLVMLREGEIEDQPAPKTKNGCSSGAVIVT